MIELMILGIFCSPFVVAVGALIGIFITGIDEVVTERRKKRAKAAEKQKKARQKAKNKNTILIRWRQ